MGRYSGAEDLDAAVSRNGGVLSVSMVDVRDAFSFQRLRKHVVKRIESQLARTGLGHYPRRLPEDQNALVRLYKLDTPFAEFVDALLRPGENGDRKIKSMLDVLHGKAGDKLRRHREFIRELVDQGQDLLEEED